MNYKFDGSKVFFTSDTHFYHGNIIHFCNRPMQHIRPVDYQCFINKMVEKSVLHFFFFAERVQN